MFENRDKLSFNVCFHKKLTLFYPLGTYQTSKKASTQASTHNLFLKRVKTNIQIYLPLPYRLEIKSQKHNSYC